MRTSTTPTARQFHRGFYDVANREQVLHIEFAQESREVADNAAVFTVSSRRAVAKFKQLREVDPQHLRNARGDLDAGRINAALDIAHGIDATINPLGQFILGQALRLAKLANTLSKLDLEIAPRHAGVLLRAGNRNHRAKLRNYLDYSRIPLFNSGITTKGRWPRDFDHCAYRGAPAVQSSLRMTGPDGACEMRTSLRAPARRMRWGRTNRATWQALFAGLLTLLSTQAFAGGKQDIFGFTPGMSYDAARAVATERKLPGCNFSKELIPTGIECGGVALWFSPVLEGNPLYVIYTIVPTTDGLREVIASLSDQFGKPLVPVKQPNGMVSHYNADLGDGKTLRLGRSGRELHLMNEALLQQSKDEEVRRTRVPMPKY